MKTRVQYAGKATGEVARLINRLAAAGDYIYGIEDLGDQWVIFTTRDVPKEVRPVGDGELVTRSWAEHTGDDPA